MAAGVDTGRWNGTVLDRFVQTLQFNKVQAARTFAIPWVSIPRAFGNSWLHQKEPNSSLALANVHLLWSRQSRVLGLVADTSTGGLYHIRWIQCLFGDSNAGLCYLADKVLHQLLVGIDVLVCPTNLRIKYT
jgi:phage gp37-like protein